VTGGLPPIRGETMAARLAYAAEHLPWLPGFLLREPRGHQDLFGAVLVPPVAAEADAGLLFMDNQGYEPMCGHAVIGAVTTLLETGQLAAAGPETTVVLDTAAGLVRATALMDGGRATAVSFNNVPSFLYRSGVSLPVPDLGQLSVDVVFGGLFFVFVAAAQIGLELVPGNAGRLATLGMRILAAANARIPVRHPELPHIDRIFDLRFYQEPGRDGADSRNVVILGDHMVDRSPCGTGTSAETALRHAQGRLGIGDSFVTESIIGTRFEGAVVGETEVGEYTAVVPRVTGSASITGFHRFVLDPDDPFPEGFRLSQM
jgi:proline racemase